MISDSGVKTQLTDEDVVSQLMKDPKIKKIIDKIKGQRTITTERIMYCFVAKNKIKIRSSQNSLDDT